MVAFLMPFQDKPLGIFSCPQTPDQFSYLRVFQGKGPTVKLRDWSDSTESPDFTARNQLNGTPITNRFLCLQVTTPKIYIDIPIRRCSSHYENCHLAILFLEHVTGPGNALFFS